jgi:hypothetical protein
MSSPGQKFTESRDTSSKTESFARIPGARMLHTDVIDVNAPFRQRVSVLTKEVVGNRMV